ncbi:hypothetical protein GCM10023322_69630 [Rugosimonospora acidiphila]|uniref:Pyrrolo-quinoline quinone repeat domain-containing protein n=1 Tax=Rugosimonospora acidiphila TaxID=556531 RepID=A0ABP9SK04_9ACTN
MVIDLGTDWEPREPESPPRGPARRRPRSTAVLLVCLLLVSTLAGAAPTASAWRLATSIPMAPADGYLLSTGRLFVTRQGTANHTRIEAYSLPDGRRLWQTALSVRADLIPNPTPPGVVLAQLGTASDTDRLAALDAATGRVLWQLAGAAPLDPSPPGAARVLLSVGLAAGTSELRLVDARTGATVWARTLTAGTVATVVGAGRLALRSLGGTAEVIDERTGATLVTGRLDTDPASTGVPLPVGFTTGLYAIDGQLLATYTSRGATRVTAYDLSTLDRRWHLDVDDLVLSLSPCGALLCVIGERGTTAVDPARGAIRWTAPHWTMVGTQPGALVAKDLPEVRDRFALLDPATGRTQLDLRDWDPIQPTAPDESMVLTTNRRGPPGLWIGALRSDGTGVQPEAFLPDAIADGCATDRPGAEGVAGGADPPGNPARPRSTVYLACITYDGPVDVWVDRRSPQ